MAIPTGVSNTIAFDAEQYSWALLGEMLRAWQEDPKKQEDAQRLQRHAPAIHNLMTTIATFAADAGYTAGKKRL